MVFGSQVMMLFQGRERNQLCLPNAIDSSVRRGLKSDYQV